MTIMQSPQLNDQQKLVLRAVKLVHPAAVLYGAWEIREIEADTWEARGYAWADNPDQAGKLEVHCKVELWPDQWRVLDLLRMDGWEIAWRKPIERKEDLKGKQWWRRGK